MGYTTEFAGRIEIDPPLSEAEAAYLKAFCETRHMKRGRGPYFVDGAFGHAEGDADVVDANQEPEDQPGLWCKWRPTEDRAGIEWSGRMKFYHAPEWMAYIRTHFLTLGAAAVLDPSMGFFTRHDMRGSIHAVGEDAESDVWRLEVDEDGVWSRQGAWTPAAHELLFGADGDGYVSGETAISELAAHPEHVEWSIERVRAPDFHGAGTAERFEAALLSRAAEPAFKARSVARSL